MTRCRLKILATAAAFVGAVAFAVPPAFAQADQFISVKSTKQLDGDAMDTDPTENQALVGTDPWETPGILNATPCTIGDEDTCDNQGSAIGAIGAPGGAAPKTRKRKPAKLPGGTEPQGSLL